jgi:hypothetical protein
MTVFIMRVSAIFVDNSFSTALSNQRILVQMHCFPVLLLIDCNPPLWMDTCLLSNVIQPLVCRDYRLGCVLDIDYRVCDSADQVLLIEGCGRLEGV